MFPRLAAGGSHRRLRKLATPPVLLRETFCTGIGRTKRTFVGIAGNVAGGNCRGKTNGVVIRPVERK